MAFKSEDIQINSINCPYGVTKNHTDEFRNLIITFRAGEQPEKYSADLYNDGSLSIEDVRGMEDKNEYQNVLKILLRSEKLRAILTEVGWL
ncbi:hypothetical protein RCG17_01270 [Neobacillus sp. PS3-12]|uniref:hypothetical protein n=1 Tax=Neobacillus sp. PS3-12 TaxID=3070677 RepID=UPI0027DF9A39|nr:hypothetical protein [Neobacillus sp. PS3-12]WML53367.1 hypothetical protein RCG17_01270 [Neobacillus sp. PS3-12]